MAFDIERLGRKLRERRTELGITQAEFAAATEAEGLEPVGQRTIVRLEAGIGSEPRPATLAGLDRGARWRPGSARTVALGGEPVPLAADLDLASPAVRGSVWMLLEVVEEWRPFLETFADLADRLDDPTMTAVHAALLRELTGRRA